MKKLLLLLLLFALAATLSACSGEPEPEDYEPTEAVESPAPYTLEASQPADEPAIYENDDADETAEEPIETAAAGSNIHGAIHRIEYGDNVAYLFGTMHAGFDHWFPLADVVEGALRRADVVAVEVDAIGNPEAMLAAVMEIMFLPDGLTWAEFLTEDAYNHLVEMMPEWGLDYALVNTQNPSLLVHNLTMGFVLNITDTQACFEFSVDNYIIDVAMSLGIPIIGMESIEQQINIVFNPPFEVMMAQIMHLFSPHDEDVLYELMQGEFARIDDLAYFYENNDIAAINDIFSFFYYLGDCLYLMYTQEKTMDWRTTYYANGIARLLRETEEPTTFFVAVGIAHVIRSAAGEGFTDIVEQLGLMGFAAVPLWE